jgi:hypothetical protein
VLLWRKRYEAEGLTGLFTDRPRSAARSGYPTTRKPPSWRPRSRPFQRTRRTETCVRWPLARRSARPQCFESGRNTSFNRAVFFLACCLSPFLRGRPCDSKGYQISTNFRVSRLGCSDVLSLWPLNIHKPIIAEGIFSRIILEAHYTMLPSVTAFNSQAPLRWEHQ